MTNNIECNTVLIKDAAQKILNNCADLETKINQFFTKLGNIPISGEWLGDNAREYSNLVVQDKEIYLKYIEGIKEIAKKMDDFADNMDNTIRKNESECQW